MKNLMILELIAWIILFIPAGGIILLGIIFMLAPKESE
jgi:hypothetical protein